jgi:hypothetical protein
MPLAALAVSATRAGIRGGPASSYKAPYATPAVVVSPDSMDMAWSGLCYFHLRFGDQVTRCEGVCTVQLAGKLASLGFLNAVIPGHLVHIMVFCEYKVQALTFFFTVHHHCPQYPVGVRKNLSCRLITTNSNGLFFF